MKYYSVNLPEMTDEIVTNPHLLQFRCRVLDEQMLKSPSGIANEVKHALINQLREQAPWLLPMVLDREI
jgi:hypothetical protein|tara:strand:- start:5453 stop:5659 length:207 start_codon:yes stop_codon:yes gene_type:complete